MNNKQLQFYLERALKIAKGIDDTDLSITSRDKLIQLQGYLEGGIELCEITKEVEVDNSPQC